MVTSTARGPGRPSERAGSVGIAGRTGPGQQAEDRACRHLQAQGLHLLARNYRTGTGRSRAGGEIDLVMCAPDGTLVFVEVRARRNAQAGGAAASVGPAKRARLLRAAQAWLARLPALPPCRFDVVAIEAGRLQWLPGAFDAGDEAPGGGWGEAG